MPKLKTKAGKKSLLRKVRKQRLKNITILPSLVTILNGLCGFAAIVFAAKGAAIGSLPHNSIQSSYFSLAGYIILLAMIADMLDGRLARISQSTSSFGGQLDSLCDMVSFGVAPAFLMLKILEYKINFAGNSAIEHLAERLIWLAAAAYISCAAIRLARFNVENEEDESTHMSFMGLPTPAAAGVIVSLVIFQQDTLSELLTTNSFAYRISENIIVYSLPVIALAMSILMVSRIRYPHIINQYIKGKKPFAHLIRVLIFLGLVIWSTQTALVLIFCGFAANGFLKWFYHKVIRRTYFKKWHQKTPQTAGVGDSENY